jgi:hypothetical protein
VWELHELRPSRLLGEEDDEWQRNNEGPALDVFGGRRCGGDKVKAIEDFFVSHT